MSKEKGKDKRFFSQRNTRSDTEDKIFGQPAPLNTNVLPTSLDIGRAILFTQHEMQTSQLSQNDSKSHLNVKFNIVRKQVAEQVQEIWMKASIPCAQLKSIEWRIENLWKKRTNLRNVEEAQKDWSKLFDICQCKCPYVKCEAVGCVNKECIEYHGILCTCSKSSKQHERENSFLHDQRHARRQTISDEIDKEATKKMNDAQARLQNEQEKLQRETKRLSDLKDAQREANEAFACLEIDDEPSSKKQKKEDEDFKAGYERKSSRNMQDLENTAEACDRLDIEDNTAAYLINAYLKDLNLLNQETIVDRKKLSRQRQKYRKKKLDEEIEKQKKDEVSSAYFDARKDATLTMKTINGIPRKTVQVEEHISIVEEPGSRYLGHVTPKDGTGEEVAKALYKSLKSIGAEKTVKVVGNDGCLANNGWDKGACACYESFTGQPLQRFSCLLHANELPLRAALVQHIGKTSGPSTYHGPISRAIHDPQLRERPIANFKKIDCPDFPVLPEEVHKDLSTDQLYLYDICHGLISGKIDESLASRSSGTIIQSRWVTTGSSLARHYASEEKPSRHLTALINIVVKLYALMWFTIKCRPKAIDGPKHLFQMISIAKKFPKEDSQILLKRIQYNAYFAHPENVLLTMLTEDEKSLRDEAVQLILKARQQRQPEIPADSVIPDETIEQELHADDLLINEVFESEELHDTQSESNPSHDCEEEEEQSTESQEEELPRHKVRAFKVPKLNFEAKSYVAMTDLETVLYEPPLTMHLSDDQIKAIIEEPLIVPNYPNHTQAVERAVKLTTEASSKVIGSKQRHGMICQKISARKVVPKFRSKQDAFPLL